MIPFLIVTSIVNIALGYALAVYLGRAYAPAWRETPLTSDFAADGLTTPFSMPKDRSWPFEGISEAPSATARQITERATLEAARPSAQKRAAEVDDAPAVRTSQIDQDLLAGIEEFRNQLSQLKGPGVAGVLSTRSH